ncbi:unnamed protein product [Boreogadus saida]
MRRRVRGDRRRLSIGAHRRVGAWISPKGWSPELTGGLEELTGGLDPGAHRRFGGSLSSAASAEPLHHSISARGSLTTKPCSPSSVVRSKRKEVLCGDPIERTYREHWSGRTTWMTSPKAGAEFGSEGLNWSALGPSHGLELDHDLDLSKGSAVWSSSLTWGTRGRELDLRDG